MRAALIVAATLVAVAGAGIIGSAGLGYRFGVWDLGTAFGILHHFTQSPFGGVAFPTAFTLAAVGAVAAGLSGLAALVAGPRGLGAVALVSAGLAAAAVGGLLSMNAGLKANPFIHDVTTDFEDPPQITAAASLPRSNPPEYLGGEAVREGDPPTAELQREAFPDIAPLEFELPPDVVFDDALAVAREFGWEILLADEQAGVIEAAATSLWFGFVDDVIVRVRPLGDGGTRVDVRSKSRVGGSDLGANAARTRKFLARLEAMTIDR